MQKLLISLFVTTLLWSTLVYADVTMHKQKSIPMIPVRPIEKPDRPVIVHPPVRPVVNTGVVYQDNYYSHTTVNNCQREIDELNDYIDSLEAQIAELKEKEHARLREKLKKENDAELKKFENRKSSVKTKNKIEIK